MKPFISLNMATVQQWCDDNLITLHRAPAMLKDVAKEIPAAYEGLHTAISDCIHTTERLKQAVQKILDSENFDNFEVSDSGLTDAEENQLLSLNRQLIHITDHLLTAVGSIRLQLQSKLVEPDDSTYDFEIEARIDYQLRADDPDFSEENDNYLSTRTFSMKSDEQSWARKNCAYIIKPVRFFSEPHCALFHDLYNHGYGAESPRLSLRDCLRVGRIFVDVQVIHQYKFDVPDAKSLKKFVPNPSWSESLQQQTRDAIQQLQVPPDGRLHLKHKTLGYAHAELIDLISGVLCLHRQHDSQPIKFDDVDELLQAGWALD